MKCIRQKKQNRTLLILSGVLLLTPLAHAAPVALDDSSLDKVTAGSSDTSGSGGAIIGNSSEATIYQTGGVTLEGDVQASAQALNLVNSAESTVANGVNVWEGSGAISTSDSNLAFAVNQNNEISQEQRRSASMPSYSRPEADTLLQIESSGSETHDNHLNVNNTQMDILSESRTAKNTSSASVDTTIAAGVTNTPTDIPDASFDTNTGKGVAVAGQMDTFLDGGEIQLGFAVGGAVSAFEDTDTSDSGFGGIEIGNDESHFTLYGADGQEPHGV